MVGYFVLIFSEEINKNAASVLKEIYKQIDKLSYFITTTRQYKAMCDLKINAQYRLNGKQNPILTCSKEQEFIKAVNQGEESYPCMVCTYSGLMTVDQLKSIVSKYEKISLISNEIVTDYGDIPFATETNFRTDIKYNNVLYKISKICCKFMHLEMWQVVKTIDASMSSFFKHTYNRYLQDYSSYLIQYCEINEQQIKKIAMMRPQIMAAINNTEDISELKIELIGMWNYFNNYCSKEEYFKKVAYLYHMIWNNLQINYGYEIVYSIVRAAL